MNRASETPILLTQFASRTAAVGALRKLSWGEWMRELDAPLVWEAEKNDLPMYAPTTFARNHRTKAGVEKVYALTFDLDAEPCVSPAEIASRLHGHACSVHTSFRHSVEAPRSRLHLLPSRPIVGWREYDAVWRRVAAVLEAAGIGVGPEAKDASRASFVASRGPGSPFEHHAVSGAPLDVEPILIASRVSADREARRREALRRLHTARPPTVREHRYAHAALNRAADNVRCAEARHTDLNRETWCVARFVRELGEDDIRDVLVEAGVEAGLSRAEATRTVDGALRARGRSAL